MRNFLEKTWYNPSIFRWLFWPIHGLFYLLVVIRHWLYKVGALGSHAPSVPVLVVGNISVGGTGKTPFIIWLVKNLQDKGIRTVVISRGYGGQANNFPLPVDENTLAIDCGDEPKLIWDATHVPVVVDPQRVRAANYAASTYSPQLIISDDGMQHYALARRAEICMIDGYRDLGNRFLMPIGPLREPPSRLNRCDLVIQNSGKKTYPLFGEIQAIEFVNLHSGESCSIANFAKSDIIAICGIANPEKFSNTLTQNNIEFRLHSFNDHYQFTENDFNVFKDKTLVMTEKDAVKCRAFSKPNWWYLRVGMQLDDDTINAVDKLIAQVLRGSNG